MSFSIIVILIIIVLLGLYSFFLLDLNKEFINLDLLFFELDLQLGHVILVTFLIGIIVSVTLEFLFFSLRKRGRSE